jgi:hypothetical protein
MISSSPAWPVWPSARTSRAPPGSYLLTTIHDVGPQLAREKSLAASFRGITRSLRDISKGYFWDDIPEFESSHPSQQPVSSARSRTRLAARPAAMTAAPSAIAARSTASAGGTAPSAAQTLPIAATAAMAAYLSGVRRLWIYWAGSDACVAPRDGAPWRVGIVERLAAVVIGNSCLE